MTPDESSARRPLVAVAYGPRSVAPMQLAEAAAPLCDLLWMVDPRLPEVAEMAPLLRQLGVVVDIGELSAPAAAREVAAFRPDGIATYFDAGMVHVAAIAQELALPFVTPDTAALLVDKVHQRAALQAAGIDVPHFWPLDPRRPVDAIRQIAPQVAWPAVLKPRSETGSHYTFLAHDADEATALLDSVGTEVDQMMLEEYLTDDPRWTQSPFADYVSVESIVSHGTISHLAVTGRLPQAETFRETGFVIPARLPSGDQHAVCELASAAIKALGVQFGCLHTEVKFTTGGPRILEVNGRIGFGIPAMLEQAASFPMLATSLRIALGERVVVDGPIHCNRVGYRLFLQPPPIRATVEDVGGISALADRPGVQTVTVHRGPGWTVDWRDGTRAFVLAVVGVAADHDEVLEVWRALGEEITVTYSADAARAATRDERGPSVSG